MVHNVLRVGGQRHDVPSSVAAAWEETDVFGDAGYQGLRSARRNSNSGDWHVAWPLKRKVLKETRWVNLVEWSITPGSFRAKVELPFHVVKNLFALAVPQLGVWQNTAQLFSLFGFANLVLARRWLLNANTQGVS